MQYFWTIVLVVCVGLLHVSVAPPVNQNKESEKENEVGHETEDDLEYHRYVTEVVQLLEGDPEFRQKLEKANEADIRTGKIAGALELVSHHVRTKLDELKRKELQRLKKLVAREKKLENVHDFQHSKVAKHLDHEDPKGFGVEDLRKLIAKVTEDIKEADEKRREEFKEYEMRKQFEEAQKLAAMDEQHKKEYQEQLEAMKKKHKEHQPLHHPGSKQQLEEVWEKQDHMDPDNFDPKTFFRLHDLDGNGFWDQTEVKTLFLKELDKLYEQGTSNEDIVKRGEEMERMREHVFAEADLDKDGVISYQEFLQRTENPSFQKDEGWEGLDDQQIYSPEEYQNYERRRLEELQNMVAQGMPPVHPDSYPVHPDQFPSQYANHQVQQGIPPHNQMHGQQPPMHGQQPPMHMSQPQYQGLPPQQQQYHDQVAYQQVHMPQQQLHQAQAQVQHNNQFQGHQQQQQQQQQQVPPQGHHPAQVLHEQQNSAGAAAAAAAHHQQQQQQQPPVNPSPPQGVQQPPQQQQQQQSGQVPQQQQPGQVPQQQQLNSQNSVLQQQPQQAPNTFQQNSNPLPNDPQHPMPAAAQIQQQIHQNSIPDIQKL